MPRHRRRPTPHLPVRVVPREPDGIALEVDGVVQSVSQGERGYWAAMLPPDPVKRALLLGVGGGTIAHLLTRRSPSVELVGVETDPRVLALAREHLGLDTLPNLTVVEGDAIAWVHAQAAIAPASFDFIALDLYDGSRLVPGSLGTPWLRQVGALLTPEGWLAVNLVRTRRLGEQVHRLERIFHLARCVTIAGNSALLLKLKH